ncbi:MAG: HAD hydrolase-like protein [Dehalococcoidia bacterium]|nr:HAD hydrolase-like protein [Dehalococcoidia bacterium]
MPRRPQTTFRELADRYSTILFDAYGVLAGSKSVEPEAPAAIELLHQLGKPYFVLTNDSSALAETRAASYKSLGLPIDESRIITSGSLLTGYFAEHDLAGSRCVVLGPPDSLRYVEVAGGCVVPCEEDFDVLVIGDQSGFPFLEAADTVLSALFRKIDARESVSLILPNPDLIYPEGDGFGFASGSLALIFESALALRYPGRPDLRFTRLGKPHPAIYREAYSRSATMDMVMIGDQIETDIKGANDFGIASALISTGVSGYDVSQLPESERPDYLIESLAI